MKILLATHNPAKLKRYAQLLSIFDVEVVTLAEFGITEKVEENFQTSLENAIFKAQSYAKLSGLPTLAIDEAVHTNFLPDDEQPGVYARRFSKEKRELTDEELLNVWLEIFKQYPQTDKEFYWDFSVAFYNPETDSLGHSTDREISYVGTHISNVTVPGYPLSQILTVTKGGKPHAEMNDTEKFDFDRNNLHNFQQQFQAWLEVQV